MNFQVFSRFFGMMFFLVAVFAPAHAGTLVREDHTAMASAITEVTKQKVSESDAVKIITAVTRIADTKNIDPFLILTMMYQESTFNKNAKSPDGSYGLMQVHYRVHRAKFKGTSPFDVDASVRIGVEIFADCMARNKGQIYRALNCYSGGGGTDYYRRFQSSRKSFDKAYALALFSRSEQYASL